MSMRQMNIQNKDTADSEGSLHISELEVKDVYAYIKTSENGLSEEESAARLNQYGENTVKSERSFYPLKSFAKNFVNLMAIMLWIASFLALISGTPILSYVIWAIIFINAIFSFVQESKADKAMQALSKMIPNNVKVFRDGNLSVSMAEQLVPGDVVTLSAGDKVPADIRIVAADGLSVDNSMLTGESVPVERDALAVRDRNSALFDKSNLLFAGTSISSGTAKGVVFATGKNSQIGNLTKITTEIVKRKSTLEIQIQRITKILVTVAIIVGILSFFISLFLTEVHISVALIFAIGIIVANIPEGLMPTVSLSLALSAQRMAQKNALIRKQSAIETLSATSVICTDKTGTLTQNAMFAKKIWTADGIINISGEGYGIDGQLTGITDQNRMTLENFFTAVSVCSNTEIHVAQEDNSKWRVIGNPTEAAILIAANKYGTDVKERKEQFEIIEEIPFSSNTKQMSVLAVNKKHPAIDAGHTVQFTKGDPLKMIELCSYLYKDGKPVVATAEMKQQMKEFNDRMANEGYRLLAIAYADRKAERNASTEGLILLGLAVMYDPPKEGVQEAIQDCYRAGIKVSVVTGDYSLTAAAIARQIGIIKDKYVTVTGEEVEKMSQDELADRINTELPVIFARTTPKHKLKIVETYQSLGHVVASTGDGINDVLALRKADIGIAMGKNGSDAAIESSDVVLLDDNFVTIVEAIKEGRAIYKNIQKFISYILASNVPEVIPFLAMGLLDIPLALTVLLILAIDLGTDLIPAISLGKELPDDDILDEPPRAQNSNILNKKVLLRSYGFLGIIEAGLLFVMFFYAWHHFGYTVGEMRTLSASIENGTAASDVMYVYSYAITLGFGAVIAAQIGNVLECRSSKLPVYKSFKKKNKLMVVGIAVEFALFLLIAYVPFFNMLFETTSIKLHHLALLLICPLILIMLEEIRKWAAGRMRLYRK
ncbi:MAG: cation-translocating P-type ATPase [Bacillus sp. (in: firmicutes)]